MSYFQKKKERKFYHFLIDFLDGWQQAENIKVAEAETGEVFGFP